MLIGAGARGRTALALLVSLLVLVGLTVTGASAAHAADSSPTPAPDLGGLPHGVTVSWPPTNKPVQITPGTTSTATFWVTNDTATAVRIDVKPATAVPGDNGSLSVTDGADARFPTIRISPSHFRAMPGSTTAIKETVTSPSNLPPGVYLLPAVVQPHDPHGKGNVKIERAVVGLSTFQVPGAVDIALDASLTPADPPAGTLTRKLPGLPSIEVGRSAGATLHVQSQASGGFYAYYEVTGTTSGIGSLTLDGHAAGLPADIRAEQSLYFPGLARDFPVTWKADALSAAKQTLTADVSFSPKPDESRTVATTMTLVVISPWWIAVAILLLLLYGVSSMRRASRLAAADHGRRRRVQKRSRPAAALPGRILAAVVAVLAGLLALYWMLGAVVVLGVVVFAVTARLLRGAASTVAARRLLVVGIVGLSLVVAAGGLLAATFARSISPGYALAMTSGAALWLLACDLLRQPTTAGAVAEPVAV